MNGEWQNCVAPNEDGTWPGHGDNGESNGGEDGECCVEGVCTPNNEKGQWKRDNVLVTCWCYLGAWEDCKPVE
ncbi:MAG: hypothetical protein MHM6MM_000253 [Cercozoa sp. M6MM]